MRNPQQGVLCAGCPHRAAYVAIKEATRRIRGRVICGNIGCAAVGHVHPAAATCPGGMEKLLPRYIQDVPSGTPEEPAAPLCVHIVLDTDFAADDAAANLTGLAGEGTSTILAVMASSRDYLERAAIERLGAKALEVGAGDAVVLDPFDIERTVEVLREQAATPGIHAAIFSSPCAQLQRPAALEPVEVDRYMCVGCHRCFQITACPALAFKPPAYEVDADACAGCDLCCGFCPSQVIYTPRARLSIEERAAARYEAARQARG